MSKSLDTFRTRHQELQEKYAGAEPPPLSKAEEFVEELRQAGKFVPDTRSRDFLQRLASYWAERIYDRSDTKVYPKTDLEPYLGPRKKPISKTWFVLAVVVVGIGIAIIMVVSRLFEEDDNGHARRTPVPPDSRTLVAHWTFDDNCTVTDWGTYTNGIIIRSPEIAPSQSPVKGQCTLEVTDITTPSYSEGTYEKLIGVNYTGSLTDALLTADVCAPAVRFEEAEAMFFLFDLEWDWIDSSEDQSIAYLIPGDCVQLVWDLSQRPDITWRNIVGIKLFVVGKFTGPVYIDNISIYK